MNFYINKVLLLLVSFVVIIQCQSTNSIDDLAWPNVKPEHKPGTYWWWMGSAVDEINLTYNLESLSEVGIGNVHVIPIYGVEGEEEKYIDFLSPQWINMLSYTGNEATKLNMNLDMSTTTGWPFGGSHVTTNDAAKKIEFSSIKLSKGKQIDKVFDMQKVEAIIAYSDNRDPVNLINQLDSNGKINWIPNDGNWEVCYLLQEGTGQYVKRAAPGNIGLVLDPFSPKALKKYLSRYDEAFTKFNTSKIRAQYHDSYEYYHATWTNNYLNEFKARNHYDLLDHLPSIFDSTRINNYIKADYRRVLAELHLEYISTWNNWSHSNGWITRNEAHGAPANLLDLYAASDIPETETFGSRMFNIPGFRYIKENNSKSMPPNPLILKFASSAANVTGKPLISAETGTWLRDHFKTALSQVKPEIDQLFFSGINHIFYHGNAYSPKDAEWPGWLFYASTHFEKENAFWRDFQELNNYVTRCQSILQSGKPSNDILLYWPIEDLYHSFPEDLIKLFNVHKIDWFLDSQFGKLADKLDKNGYSFDYISDKQLQKVTSKKNSLITSGNSYKTIIIPKTEYMPINTWKKLKLLASSGARIIFHNSLPNDVPGYFNLEERRAELKKSLSELEFKSFSNIELQKAAVGKGYFLKCENIKSALNYTGIKNENIVSNGISYIRRVHDEGYFYFFSNLSSKKLDSWVTLSQKFKSAVIYDPRFEKKIGVATSRQKEDSSEIYLQLQPGESCFVKTFTSELIKSGDWKYFESMDDSITINGKWKVDFIDGGPQLPASFTTNKLLSWTILGDSATQSFAGTGKYSISFNLPNVVADDWLLNLGEVCESASVRVNGKNVGKLWSFPFNILVGEYLKLGENILEIEVTNLSANRIRNMDSRGIDWEKFFFVNIFYEKFNASNWPIMNSGLIGPIKLVPVKFSTL